MAHRLRDIVAALGAQAAGDLDILIDRASEPSTAGPNDLALAMDPRYADGLLLGKAQAAVLWVGADWQNSLINAGGRQFRVGRLIVLHR